MKGYPVRDNLFLMTIQVLKGTILVEIEVDCSGCYKDKELYCEKNIFIHCCTVNAKSYGFTSTCKRAGYSK